MVRGLLRTYTTSTVGTARSRRRPVQVRGRACENAREELDANGLRISLGGGAPRGRVGLVAAVARHEEEAQPHLLRPPLDELDLEAARQLVCEIPRDALLQERVPAVAGERSRRERHAASVPVGDDERARLLASGAAPRLRA
eukprot:scaffold60928_cov68-Phaeocystis_antarctica.AAC.6